MSERSHNDIYKSYVEDLLIARRESFGQFDKAVLTLSSGALALSLTSLQWMLDRKIGIAFTPLVYSWIFLTIAIVTTLFSFRLVPKAIDAEMIRAENFYLKRDEDAYKRKGYDFVTWVNRCSLISFIIGISLMLITTVIIIKKQELPVNRQGKDKVHNGFTPTGLNKVISLESELKNQEFSPNRAAIISLIVQPKKAALASQQLKRKEGTK